MKRLEKTWSDDEILLHSWYDKENDKLYITMKNIKTDSKRLITLDNPHVPVYIIKKDVKITRYNDEVPLEDLDIHWVPEKYREAAIAEILGMKTYNSRVKNGTMKPKHVYLHKRCVGSDVPIGDLLLREFVKRFTKNNDKGIPLVQVPKLEKFHIGALDIETDILVSEEQSKQPINVITYIDGKTMEIRTIAVRNSQYKGQAEIEKDIKKFEKELIAMIRHNVENIDIPDDNAITKMEREKQIKEILLPMVDKLSLNLTFTNSEAKMIRDINKHVFSEVNPDFLYIYNAAYDISQQELRSQELGINFPNLFKFKDQPAHIQFDYSDKRFDIKKKNHTYNSSNPTKILDQMLLYYQLRVMNNYSKHGLDATATRELGTAKLNYSKVCNYIGDFPYVDFKLFLMYNIIDVLIMIFLDAITFDTMTLVYKRYNLITEWERLGASLKRTTNAFDYYAYLQGYINANEINALFLGLDDEAVASLSNRDKNLQNVIRQLKDIKKIKDIEKDSKGKVKNNPYRIPGGMVTKPSKISDKIKDKTLYGNLAVKGYSKLINCADNDASSMYPSNVQANNASRATLVGNIIGVSNNDEESIDKLLSMSIINHNQSSIGKYLYNLPTIEELLDKYKNIKPTDNDLLNISMKLNKKDMVFTEEEFSKDASAYISWWRKCYATKYNDSDQDSGAPTNSLIIFSDKQSNEFVYYGSKVIVTTNVPTNSLINRNGVGLSCGKFTSRNLTFENFYQDYVDSLKTDAEEPILGDIISEGVFDINILKKIDRAKFRTTTLQLGDRQLDIIRRLIFTDHKTPINWSIHRIVGNHQCLMLRLYSNHIITKTLSAEVEQRIIFYDMLNKGVMNG